MSKEPINIGDLDPQQRLDVARGEKLGADGLDVFIYAHELLDVGSGGVWLGCPDEESVRKAHIPDETGEEVVALCRLTDAQRLLSQLREELAQRDAEVRRLWADRKTDAALIHELRTKLHALDSQQAASVGGEREDFEAAWNKATNNNDGVAYYVEISGKYCFEDIELAYQMFRNGCAYQRAALSPAGGGVDDKPTCRICEQRNFIQRKIDEAEA